MFNIFKKQCCSTCEHKWKIINQFTKDYRNCPDDIVPYLSVITYVLQCDNCGDIKTVKVEL